MGMDSITVDHYIHFDSVHNSNAAGVVVPLLLKILQKKINAVVDVGCGTGTWLKVCKDSGVTDVTGIDASYVDKASLLIDAQNEFIEQDISKPFTLNRTFDLVLCLEVAEHLPASSAKILVPTLVSLGDHILFSAAVPGQGGQYHINEQWPQYWIKLFKEHGYTFYDVLRPLLWNEPTVDWWYRQNIFLVVNDKYHYEHKAENILPLIHPEMFAKHMDEKNAAINTLQDGISSGRLVSGKTALKVLLKKLFFK